MFSVAKEQQSGFNNGQQSIHSAQNIINDRTVSGSLGPLQKGKKASGLLKFDQQSSNTGAGGAPSGSGNGGGIPGANMTSQSFASSTYMGQMRRPGSRGLQHSERTYQPQGIGAQISGQNFYKALGTDLDAQSIVDKQPEAGPFKKLKINAEYL